MACGITPENLRGTQRRQKGLLKMKISNDYDALVMALTLAITAPNDEKAAQCVEMAENIASSLSELEVERAKKEAQKNAFEEME